MDHKFGRICFLLIATMIGFLGRQWVIYKPHHYFHIFTSDENTSSGNDIRVQLNLSVNTFTCKIKKLDPWDESIQGFTTRVILPKCPRVKDLTYRQGDWILVRKGMYAKLLKKGALHCQYEEIGRAPKADSNIRIYPPKSFDPEKGFLMTREFIQVSCFNKKVLLYRNVHALILKEKTDEKLMKHFEGLTEKTASKKKWNVLLLGTDSISRSSAIRYMPRTVEYLKKKHKAFDFRGYNKVGVNTFPNLVPMLTGFHKDELYKGPTLHLDYMPLLFKSYSDNGYVTLYAEDEPHLGTFNYLKAGFLQPPTDFYLRPGMIGFHHNVRKRYTGCARKLSEAWMVESYLDEFVDKFRNQNFFAFTFFTGLSHELPSDARHLDYIYHRLFKKFEQYDIWSNTIVFFFGDHGQRVGRIMHTPVGRDEDRLPAMFIAFPERFRKNFPEHMRNLKINTHRLTTNFDIHRTLAHILNFTGKVLQNSETDRSQSLFSEITPLRTCGAAGIPLQHCSCNNKIDLPANEAHAYEAAELLVKRINTILSADENVCYKLTLQKVHKASKVLGFEGVPSQLEVIGYYQISFTTEPGYGHFEGTIRSKNAVKDAKKGVFDDFSNLQVSGDIVRVNKYGNTSSCVMTPVKRRYCYCKSNVS